MKNFKDKVGVITGAGSGMGRSYALMFAKLGSKVALCDYDEKGLKETINWYYNNKSFLSQISKKSYEKRIGLKT